MTGRRKLSAVDDPLALSGAAAPPRRVAPATPTRELPALFVRLPVEQTDALARAAFELRVHKRELVAALVARYVATTPEGLAALRELVDGFRRLSD
jgi:hypothetical protein